MSAPKPPRKPGRPRLDPAGAARVVLPAQRVRPDTLAYLAKHPKGIGQAIDAAVAAQRMVHHHFAAVGILDPSKR